MPSKTPAQARFMAAVAHGWKPKHPRGKLPPVKVAKEFNAADKGSRTLSEGMKKRRKGKGGALRYANGGPVRDPLRTPPKSGRGALGSLGSTARLGGLGDSARPRVGFAGRPSASGAGRRKALEGRGVRTPRPTSNVRPRPGRGVNALLATSGTPYHEASDRLDSIRKRLQSS